MASNRWVAIDPDILTHPLVGAGQPVEPADPTRGSYSRMEAWVWLICNASFADHTVMNRGRKMTLKRGDLLGAWAYLAFQWNWSAKTVRIWIEKLIADKMLQRRAIEQQNSHVSVSDDQGTSRGKQKGNQAQVLTIQNYWRYQFERHEEGQAPWLAGGQAKGNQGASKGQHITKEQGNKGTPIEITTTAAEPAAAVGGGGYLTELNGSAVDVTAFIAKHAMVDETDARSMLANNIKAFTADAMLEAYSITMADMAGSMIAKPYKYLIETARRIKDARLVKAERAAGPSKKPETAAEKIRRFEAEDAARSKAGVSP